LDGDIYSIAYLTSRMWDSNCNGVSHNTDGIKPYRNKKGHSSIIT